MERDEDRTSPVALEHVVVELGERPASAYCGKLLAELGATVIKVEQPEGDPLRRGGDTGNALFGYLNGAKKSLAVDLAAPAGVSTLNAVLAKADLVIDGLGAGELERLGVPLGEGEAGPRAAVRISDFGQSGPYREYPTSPLVTQAAGGWVIDRGQRNRVPVRVGGSVHEYTAGVYAAVALLTAAKDARLNQRYVEADLSVSATLQATIPFQEDVPGTDPTFIDLATRPFPMTIVQAKDGWVGLNCLTGQQWRDACAMVGAPEYDGRREDLRADRELLAGFIAKVGPWFAAHTVSEIVELGQAFRIPAAPLGTAERLLGEPHFVEREEFRRARVGDVHFRAPGPPYRLSRTPARPSTESLPEPYEVPA